MKNLLPQYCSKCGNKMIINENKIPKIIRYDVETREPIYSNHRVNLVCPNNKWFNNHDNYWCELDDEIWERDCNFEGY